MKYDPERHHRRSIRLPGWDYASEGAYFVTICTQERLCLFGEVIDGEMRLNRWGEIVRTEWFQTAVVRPYVVLYDDEFVVMPNHVHGIIWIMDDVDRNAGRGAPGRGAAPLRPYPETHRIDTHGGRGAGGRGAAPLRPYPETLQPPINVAPRSLGAIVRAFKSAVTKRINALRDTPGAPVWQRNYYEHIIRNERELGHLREYILNNPANWASDENNPDLHSSPEVHRR